MTTPDITRQDPAYDRAALKPRILHIGFGAFSRAHTMWILDRGLDAEGGDWGVIAARLNSGQDQLDALDAEDGLFHVAAADGESAVLRQLGCVIGTRHPLRDGGDALPDLIADADLRLVTMTITEKGYCQDGGALDRSREDLRTDLAAPREPRTAIGILAEGLRRRIEAGAGPITLLSCDNIPSNGRMLHRVLTDYAREIDEGLAGWIDANCTFPSAMVDRITPAMDDEGRALIREALGHDDPNAIVTEPFLQWVIEDSFATERPPFAAGGAELVSDVTPFEEMKLRLLNGAHTFLAHAGRLLGHETVADTMSDADLRDFARALMLDEQAATLDMPEDVDVPAYADALIARFENTRLRHRLDQIAQDTSQKMPQRLLAALGENIAAGRAHDRGALAVASWIAALRDLPPVADPRGEELREAAATDDPARAVLTLRGIATDPEPLIGPVRDALARIDGGGLRAALNAKG
ncbi:mannitol dehydrogenase family protein [Palleronia sp. LCG004]|uniref:mannitol dehydrogenase family protein n=1 Tax=Palleronia sp. LCG004 TaxID=3079304 RepID=UPI002943CED1|nr:mannitol dehydrogenase family protein [Palleronia sp. LCG004]WOI56559.1 mannitol dehydrogenase family protein [Palleronia sp. LCG004]